jgi:DNA-binding MarR family transcriptional regulator
MEDVATLQLHRTDARLFRMGQDDWLACVVIYSGLRRSADGCAVEKERRAMAVRRQVRAAQKRAPLGTTDQVEGDEAERLRAVVSRVEEETMLWQEFLRAHRTIVEKMADQMMRDHNLPLEWFDVLIHLADVPEGTLRQRALRDRLLLSESGVSRLLLRMEQAGLIARSTAGEDKRGIEITLTQQGRSAVIGATESHVDMVSKLFSQRLTQTDRNALTRVLPKLAAESEDFASPLNGT